MRIKNGCSESEIKQALEILQRSEYIALTRATWIAAHWNPESTEAVMPPRFSESWSDKFADKLPTRLWLEVRIIYYVFSAAFLALIAAGMSALISRRHG